jgi:hypothetical protein
MAGFRRFPLTLNRGWPMVGATTEGPAGSFCRAMFSGPHTPCPRIEAFS